jgi:hypothetical protein
MRSRKRLISTVLGDKSVEKVNFSLKTEGMRSRATKRGILSGFGNARSGIFRAKLLQFSEKISLGLPTTEATMVKALRLGIT